MISKKVFYILFSLPQILAVYYVIVRLAEAFKLELLGFILSLPILVTFPVGPLLLITITALYTWILFWLEPLIYFLYLRKKYPISNNKWRHLFEVSFVVVPIVFIFLLRYLD